METKEPVDLVLEKRKGELFFIFPAQTTNDDEKKDSSLKQILFKTTQRGAAFAQ